MRSSTELSIRVAIRNQGCSTLSFNEQIPLGEMDFDTISTLMSQFHALRQSLGAPATDPQRGMVLDIEVELRQGEYGNGSRLGEQSAISAKDFREMAAVMAALHEFMQGIKAEHGAVTA